MYAYDFRKQRVTNLKIPGTKETTTFARFEVISNDYVSIDLLLFIHSCPSKMNNLFATANFGGCDKKTQKF